MILPAMQGHIHALSQSLYAPLIWDAVLLVGAQDPATALPSMQSCNLTLKSGGQIHLLHWAGWVMGSHRHMVTGCILVPCREAFWYTMLHDGNHHAPTAPLTDALALSLRMGSILADCPLEWLSDLQGNALQPYSILLGCMLAENLEVETWVRSVYLHVGMLSGDMHQGSLAPMQGMLGPSTLC